MVYLSFVKLKCVTSLASMLLILYSVSIQTLNGFIGFIFFLFRMKTGAFLSTGFFTMILAMDMCDRISVYGMIDDNYCR